MRYWVCLLISAGWFFAVHDPDRTSLLTGNQVFGPFTDKKECIRVRNIIEMTVYPQLQVFNCREIQMPKMSPETQQ